MSHKSKVISHKSTRVFLTTYDLRVTTLLIILTSFSFFTYGQRYELNKKDTSEVKWVEGKKFYILKVDKKETMYSLSKRFNVTQDELVKYNPDLKYGLRAKMEIQIPATRGIATAIKPVVEEPVIAKNSYNISLFLPLTLWKNFLPEYSGTDSAPANIVPESVPQLEFYEGALKAAEELASKDFKIKLQVFDTGNDTARVSIHLRDPFVKQSDYIVVSGNNPLLLKQVNQFAELNKVKLLTYALNAADVVSNNANAFAFIPSSNLQCNEAARLVAAKYKTANPLIIRGSMAREIERATAYSAGWNAVADVKTKTIDFNKEGIQTVYASLSHTKPNIVFVPSSNEEFVSSITRQLADTVSTYQITLIGIPTWQYFETVDASMLEKLNTHIFTSSAVLLNSSRARIFTDKFTEDYQKAPSDAAFEGYDAISFIRHLHDLKKMETPLHFKGLFSDYEFIKNGSAYENHHVNMLRYSNFELVEAK